jgi:HAD superfamily hydrolase (TIGR01484 family)
VTPLHRLPRDAWAGVWGVFTDIDDTLTTAGVITDEALAALAKLDAAGVTVIPITGRPAGWSAPFALAWPVRAIVAENGAVALHRANMASDGTAALAGKDSDDQLVKTYQADPVTRAANYRRLQQVAECLLREVPGSTLARDSAGRETDIAVDHGEFTRLDPEQIDAVVRIMRREGLNVSVSSIHINGWIGEHDKWQGACWITRELLGHELPAEIERSIYVGDSTNDQVMFQHFRHSVGVANIRHFENQLQHRPRHVTQSERGAGFAEVADRVLADRDTS